VSFLKVLNEHYRAPFLEKPTLISHEDCQTLFQNIPQILQLHQSLLERLEHVNFPFENFIDAGFLDFIPFLKIYTEYCNGHTVAVQLLQQKRKNNKTFAKWCRDRRKHSRGLELESLLIMPVQRIPRILLLFKELVRCTIDTPLEAKMMECHKAMSHVIEHVNEMKRRFNMNSEYESLIKEKWSVDFMLTHRHFLLKSDNITIRHENISGSFDVSLFSDLMIFYTARRPTFVGSLYLAFVTLAQMDAKQRNTSKKLQIFFNDVSFTFVFSSPSEREQWYTLLTATIGRLKRSLLSMRGLNHPERLPKIRESCLAELARLQQKLTETANEATQATKSLNHLMKKMAESPVSPHASVAQNDDTLHPETDDHTEGSSSKMARQRSFSRRLAEVHQVSQNSKQRKKEALIQLIDVLTKEEKRLHEAHKATLEQLKTCHRQIVACMQDNRFFFMFPYPMMPNIRRKRTILGGEKPHQSKKMEKRFYEIIAMTVDSEKLVDLHRENIDQTVLFMQVPVHQRFEDVLEETTQHWNNKEAAHAHSDSRPSSLEDLHKRTWEDFKSSVTEKLKRNSRNDPTRNEHDNEEGLSPAPLVKGDEFELAQKKRESVVHHVW